MAVRTTFRPAGAIVPAGDHRDSSAARATNSAQSILSYAQSGEVAVLMTREDRDIAWVIGAETPGSQVRPPAPAARTTY
jgi:hypothetical protein